AFYGLGASDDEFALVPLGATPRRGLLTQASVLAGNAHAAQTSPTVRGKFVREQLLCDTLAPPPDNVDITPPKVPPGATAKEALEAHATDPSCAGCHRYMDPIGIGFEHFDGVGLWRDGDGDTPIDAAGVVYEIDDGDRPFDGTSELGDLLAHSEQVRSCVV